MCVRARASVPEEPYLIDPNWVSVRDVSLLGVRGEIEKKKKKNTNESHWYEIRVHTDLKWEWIHRTHMA